MKSIEVTVLPLKETVLRDKQATSTAERMRRPPVGGDTDPAAKGERGQEVCVAALAIFLPPRAYPHCPRLHAKVRKK